jgi:hypothetical protein
MSSRLMGPGGGRFAASRSRHRAWCSALVIALPKSGGRPMRFPAISLRYCADTYLSNRGAKSFLTHPHPRTCGGMRKSPPPLSKKACLRKKTAPTCPPCTHKSRLVSSGWSTSALPPPLPSANAKPSARLRRPISPALRGWLRAFPEPGSGLRARR